jgi:hypothetical protein
LLWGLCGSLCWCFEAGKVGSALLLFPCRLSLLLAWRLFLLAFSGLTNGVLLLSLFAVCDFLRVLHLTVEAHVCAELLASPLSAVLPS